MENHYFNYGEDNVPFLLFCLFCNWQRYHSVYVEAVCSQYVF